MAGGGDGMLGCVVIAGIEMLKVRVEKRGEGGERSFSIS